MTRSLLFCLSLVAAANANEVGLPEQAPAAAEGIAVCQGVVTLAEEVHLSARMPAIVSELLVREGDKVKAGQVLGRLDDEQARADVAIAVGEREVQRMHKEDNIEERSAMASAEVASAEHAEAVEINDRTPGTLAPLRIRRLRLAESRARLEVEVAGLKQRIHELEFDLSGTKVAAAEAYLRRHELVSSLNGEIARRTPRVGEWVEPGDPVFHIVRMDRLRLEWLAPLDKVQPHHMHGLPITAEVALGQGETTVVQGVVSFVSPMVEPSGDYRVWCEFDNRQVNGEWLIRPGQVATIRIYPKPKVTEERDAFAKSGAD